MQEVFGRSSVASGERDRGAVEVPHRFAVGILVSREPRAFGEAALGLTDVAPVELDVPEVVQLDHDHPQVADPAVEREALAEQRGRLVIVA